MTDENNPLVIPRSVPEGIVPLIAVEGTAYECGCQYAEIVLQRYPGYREYLDQADYWLHLPPIEGRLVERHAPHLLEVYRGLTAVAGPAQGGSIPSSHGCTSFGLSGSVTLDGNPISGQTKDTASARAELYITLRMQIKGAPNILVLAYPGEVLGYGMWSTGMTIFRNTLYSSAGAPKGLDMMLFGHLALSCAHVAEVEALAAEYGIKGAGNLLISDGAGESCSFEFNVGGTSVLRQEEGILTHANHPEGELTMPHASYPFKDTEPDSVYRMHGLAKRLAAERGRLTAQKVLMLLADHVTYPLGTCKHQCEGGAETTAAVIAEPTRGLLHVVRGHPCCNWPVTYKI